MGAEASAQTHQILAARFSLDKRNAIVTGGSTGIGREVVKGLAELGARVVFNSTTNSQEAAESLVAEVKDKGGEAIWVPGDVRLKETTDSLIKTTRDRLGAPHILVACAGVTRDGAFVRQSDQDFDDVYDIKVNSARRLTQGVVGLMGREKWNLS